MYVRMYGLETTDRMDTAAWSAGQSVTNIPSRKSVAGTYMCVTSADNIQKEGRQYLHFPCLAGWATSVRTMRNFTISI